MVSGASRVAYLETGLAVLSDLGYGGLKLAEVCNRLGVTTGSFYHYFDNWPTYTKELVEHWRQANTVRLVEWIRTEPDPRQRIGTIIGVLFGIPLQWFVLNVLILEESGYLFAMQIPWLDGMIIALIAMSAATLAGLGPALHSVRMRIPEAIAYE